MSEEKPVLVDPEAWAAAQVEEAVKGLEKAKRGKQVAAKTRGVYFRFRENGEALGPKGQRGEWWVLWYDADSRRHREKAGTKSMALDLYRRRKTEVRQGKHFPESMRAQNTPTLAEVCADYCAVLKGNGKDPRGQVARRLAEVCEILGHQKAEHVKALDIEALKGKLALAPGRPNPEDPAQERPRSAATCNRYTQDIRAAYNLAKRNGKVERSPVDDVKLLPEENQRTREATAAEEAVVLAALDPATRRGNDLRPLVRFLLTTGLRLGEALGLLWSDIDWRATVATLRKTKAGRVQYATLSETAVEILKALGPGDGFVFAWPDGRSWSSSYVTAAFKKAARGAGVKNLRVHDLRHTFASRLIRGGCDIYTVSKLLRHASVKMSERYAHLSQGDLKAAVDKSTATPTATSGEMAV